MYPITEKGMKHKPGARGSTEEDTSIAKKQNMAAAEAESAKVEDSATSEDSCEQNEVKEICLKQIMTLLQNVELTLQEMRAESTEYGGRDEGTESFIQ